MVFTRHALTICFRVFFIAKPVPTFARHALELNSSSYLPGRSAQGTSRNLACNGRGAQLCAGQAFFAAVPSPEAHHV